MIVSLNDMKTGQKGVVNTIQGGMGLLNRLGNLGVRPGVEITKVSSQFMRGPVTIKVGNTQIALGFGMAARIMVKI